MALTQLIWDQAALLFIAKKDFGKSVLVCLVHELRFGLHIFYSKPKFALRLGDVDKFDEYG